MSLLVDHSERCSNSMINTDTNNNHEISDGAGLGKVNAKFLTENRSRSPINVDALNQLLVLSNPNTKLILKRPESIDVNNLTSKENIVSETLGETILTTPISPNSGFESDKRIHRVVLTGGPCAGKTTSINRIKSFFENIGWKAFCVPETASLLIGSGIHFYELGPHTIDFQENLLKTLLQIEDTINETVKFYHKEKKQNCIVIYDRGAMDPVAYLKENDWEILKQRNPLWNEVDLRDNRYDQIVHMVTAAIGAEQFYMLDNNLARTESIEVARECDEKCAKAWIGHPYFDVIDNYTEFEMKIARVLQAVCTRIGLQLKGFDIGNRKRKFLVKQVPDIMDFPKNYQDFNVIHNYLVSNSPKIQARIRKRGQSNVWSYTYTVRVKEDDQMIETRRQIDKREYAILYKTIDINHYTVYKLRRCFEWSHRYFQLDIYEEPCNPKCRGLAILSTHSLDEDLLLPSFLSIDCEITSDLNYSMYNLSLKKS